MKSRFQQLLFISSGFARWKLAGWWQGVKCLDFGAFFNWPMASLSSLFYSYCTNRWHHWGGVVVGATTTAPVVGCCCRYRVPTGGTTGWAPSSAGCCHHFTCSLYGTQVLVQGGTKYTQCPTEVVGHAASALYLFK